MSTFDELIIVLKSLLTEQFAPKPNYIRGVLGDGTGEVNVPNRPDYDYARFNRGSTEAFEIFNKNAPSVNDWPVLIGEFPWQPGLTQIVGTDWSAYEQSNWGDGVTTNEPHAPTHVWRDGFVGADPLNIYNRAIAPGRGYSPAATGSVVYVNAFEYHTGTIWPGTPGVDLQPIMSSLTTGSAQFAGVYVDRDNSLGVVTGTSVVDTQAFDPPLVAFPWRTIPIARIRLYGGQAGLKESDFRDARRMWDFTASAGARPAPGEIMVNSVSFSDLDTAIAAMSAGDILRLGKGTFTRTSPITFPNNVTIVGDGFNKTTLTVSIGTASGPCISVAGITIKGMFLNMTGEDSAADLNCLDINGGNASSVESALILGNNTDGTFKANTVRITGATLISYNSDIQSSDGSPIHLGSGGTFDARAESKLTAASGNDDVKPTGTFITAGAGISESVSAGVTTTGYYYDPTTLHIEKRLLLQDNNVPLNITARSSAPPSPVTNDIYLDDGTNTGDSNPHFRRWTGAAWEDIG